MGILVIPVIALDALLGYVVFHLFGWAGLIVTAVLFSVAAIVYFILTWLRKAPRWLDFIMAPIVLVFPLILTWFFGWLAYSGGWPEDINQWRLERGFILNTVILICYYFIVLPLTFIAVVVGGIIACCTCLNDDDQLMLLTTLIATVITFLCSITFGGMSTIAANYSF